MNSLHKSVRLERLVLIGIVCLLLNVLAFAHAGTSIEFQSALKAYEKGDYKTAYKMFKPLAERGDHDAQFCLGVMFANGYGVPKDYIQAHMWLNLAGMGGDQKTEELRDFVEKRMTSFDISAAQHLAREWMKEHED